MKLDSFKFKSAAMWGVFASLLGGVALFLVFRVSIELVSVAAVGCWALIQGLLLVSRISDIGAGANITRVIASSTENEFSPPYWRIVIAGFAISSLPVLVIGGAIVNPISWYVAHQYSGVVSSGDIAALTVIAFGVGLLGSMAGVVLAALEGAFQIASRNRITVLANAVSLCLAYPVIYSFGIVGIGLTYLVIPLVQLLAGGWLLLRISRRSQPSRVLSFPNAVRILWTENLQLSAISLCRLSFEPVTKFALSVIAPLAVIAAFELALRISTQARVTVQSAVQPLLALGSHAGPEMDLRTKMRFRTAHKRVKMIAAWIGVLMLLASPAFSILGLAYFDLSFFIFFTILMLANTINAFGLVGYYSVLSSGRLKILLRVHLVMMATNITGASVSLLLSSPISAVISYALTFIIGGAFCMHATPKAGLMRKRSLRHRPLTAAKYVLLSILACGACILYIQYAARLNWIQSFFLSAGLTLPFALTALFDIRRTFGLAQRGKN